MRREWWCMEDYDLLKKLYEGATSKVYMATCKQSGITVALKCYKKSALHAINHAQVSREIAIHSSISHPHIIDFYGSFEDNDVYYLVQEYAPGGDLFDEMRRRSRLIPEKEAVTLVVAPMLKVLQFLHGQGIIHRDIKPENILFSKDMKLKLTDFGLSINQNDERPVTRAGTLQYMAPEVLKNPSKSTVNENKDRDDLVYDHKVDTWALAVVTYELLMGFPTFGKDGDATVSKILAAKPCFFPNIRKISPSAEDFIRASLNRTAAKRSSAEALLEHPWITENKGKDPRPSRHAEGVPLPWSPSAGMPPLNGHADVHPHDRLSMMQRRKSCMTQGEMTREHIRRSIEEQGPIPMSPGGSQADAASGLSMRARASRNTSFCQRPSIALEGQNMRSFNSRPNQTPEAPQSVRIHDHFAMSSPRHGRRVNFAEEGGLASPSDQETKRSQNPRDWDLREPPKTPTGPKPTPRPLQRRSTDTKPHLFQLRSVNFSPGDLAVPKSPERARATDKSSPSMPIRALPSQMIQADAARNSLDLSALSLSPSEGSHGRNHEPSRLGSGCVPSSSNPAAPRLRSRR